MRTEQIVHSHDEGERCNMGCIPREQWKFEQKLIRDLNKPVRHRSLARRRTVGVLKYLGFIAAVAIISAAFFLAALGLGNRLY